MILHSCIFRIGFNTNHLASPSLRASHDTSLPREGRTPSVMQAWDWLAGQLCWQGPRSGGRQQAERELAAKKERLFHQ